MQLHPVNLAGLPLCLEEMPGAVREGDSALHFCEGNEGYITMLCYPSPPQSVLYLLLRVLLAVG